MLTSLLLLLGSLFLLSSAALFIAKNERRDIFLERLHLKRRRDSGSKTPPRSLSPEKKRSQIVSAPDYSTTFPPSRRSTLAETGSLSTFAEVEATSHLSWIKCMLPMKESYLEATDNTYTPCEFSIAEVKALGDFPDYATLSGVPLPKPYHDFDIHKALPRPYRPFRWVYHQTMCKMIQLRYLRTYSLCLQHLQRWSPTGGSSWKTPTKSA